MAAGRRGGAQERSGRGGALQDFAGGVRGGERGSHCATAVVQLHVNPRVPSRSTSSGLKLTREFYAQPVLVVARECIGKILVHRTPDGEAAGRIVEVEAYRGPLDLASHSSRGLTRRTAAMFGPPGHAYVYLLYGLSWAMNLVVGPQGAPHAILIRGLEPVRGADLMAHRRGKSLSMRGRSSPRLA